MPKRRKPDTGDEEHDTTSRKTRRTTRAGDVSSPARTAVAITTPSGRRSILKSTPANPNVLKPVEATPSSLRKVLFSTPLNLREEDDNEGEEQHEETPTKSRNDRSARRESQRTLQRQLAEGNDSDDEQNAHDEAIAQAILGGSDEEDGDDVSQVETSGAPDTPSKTGRPRGRPKGRRRDRTPSPPLDLPPHELYFFQNRAAANKTSANTMPSHVLLNHGDYYAQVSAYEDPHAGDVRRLESMHKRAFVQWMFELQEGFNICLYGYGSKRDLLMEFAEHIYIQSDKPAEIIMVNGYTPGLTIRDILTSLAGVLIPKTTKLPAQPPALLELIIDRLTVNQPKQPIHLCIHSLDHPNLRKVQTQTLLSQLACHPAISLTASCDTTNFPLLWDLTLTTRFNFVFHDATTFNPYTAEIEVVEDVNALLGRSSRRLGGKDGVGYVLKSLPENAKNLFRILVAEQLAVVDSEGDMSANDLGVDKSDLEDILGVEDEEEAVEEQSTPSRRGKRGRPPKKVKAALAKAPVASAAVGVEYRTLYHRAVEEFVCSSEVNFRTLLKEFHDHQMIESRKDPLGTERLIVPFKREELESILEELV